MGAGGSPDPSRIYNMFYKDYVEDLVNKNPYISYGKVKNKLDKKIDHDFRSSSLSPKISENLARGPKTLMKRNGFLKSQVDSLRFDKWESEWESLGHSEKLNPSTVSGHPDIFEKLKSGRAWSAKYFL